uniref:Uncharacterized protein n=1 Tax=Globodera rostochiensis TaxID=31243 RepID=A0A914HM47_GLORO
MGTYFESWARNLLKQMNWPDECEWLANVSAVHLPILLTTDQWAGRGGQQMDFPDTSSSGWTRSTLGSPQQQQQLQQHAEKPRPTNSPHFPPPTHKKASFAEVIEAPQQIKQQHIFVYSQPVTIHRIR